MDKHKVFAQPNGTGSKSTQHTSFPLELNVNKIPRGNGGNFPSKKTSALNCVDGKPTQQIF